MQNPQIPNQIRLCLQFWGLQNYISISKYLQFSES